MTQPGTGLAHLRRHIWQAPLTDPYLPERDLQNSLMQGATYDEMKAGLRCLVHLDLPGAEVSAQAQARWPNSIDMALLAFDLAPALQKQSALEQLYRCVTRHNRRRAALAGAYLRADRPAMAQKVLEQIDLSSATAAEDIHRRAELSLAQADFMRAGLDIDWLEGNGRVDDAVLLRMQLCYRRDGVAALQAWLKGEQNYSPTIWAWLFQILMSEGDFRTAQLALAQWQERPEADPVLISRAQTRLALERGDAQLTDALLHDRLQAQPQWQWQAADHVQWLRAGQLALRDPDELLAHARAACRMYATHHWLHHLCRVLRESVEDWGHLAPQIPASTIRTETALIAARAALRMGLSGQAARVLAFARRCRLNPQMMDRIMSLRAEAFWTAGRVQAAMIAQKAAMLLAPDAGRKADAALLGAEIALLNGDTSAATQMLAPLAQAFPHRMALHLTQARIAFMQGDFAMSMKAHARFNALKLAQTGITVPADVRDRIVGDAYQAARGQEAAFAPDLTVAQSIAQVGHESIIAAPGLSACLLWRAHMRGDLMFEPDFAADIPRQIAHYWQGPPGPALARARAQWARLHPGFAQCLFDDATATDWLRQNYPADMAQRFQSLAHPALRADLFRLCWILQKGGIFADLDEYPRIPVASWLEGARAVLCVERGFGTIANNFIAAEPDHPICAMALEFVCAALDHTDAPYAWWHGGPAQWTRGVFAHLVRDGGTDVRLLSQSQYCRRVATNLPYPHKRSPEHWR